MCLPYFGSGSTVECNVGFQRWVSVNATATNSGYKGFLLLALGVQTVVLLFAHFENMHLRHTLMTTQRVGEELRKHLEFYNTNFDERAMMFLTILKAVPLTGASNITPCLTLDMNGITWMGELRSNRLELEPVEIKTVPNSTVSESRL